VGGQGLLGRPRATQQHPVRLTSRAGAVPGLGLPPGPSGQPAGQGAVELVAAGVRVGQRGEHVEPAGRAPQQRGLQVRAVVADQHARPERDGGAGGDEVLRDRDGCLDQLRRRQTRAVGGGAQRGAAAGTPARRYHQA
jgi:hypothetical protein